MCDWFYIYLGIRLVCFVLILYFNGKLIIINMFLGRLREMKGVFVFFYYSYFVDGGGLLGFCRGLIVEVWIG